MNQRAPRLLSCGCVLPRGQTCEHQRASRLAADRRRRGASERGYDRKWAKASTNYLKLPGNERCACGCGRAADMIDHIIAPKGDMRLFWNRANWQPFARVCNTRKAIKHEGGFGRPAAPQKTFAKGDVTAGAPRRETPGPNFPLGGNNRDPRVW